MLRLINYFRTKQAFTLIETLVVIAIIAVLSSIILVGMNNAVQSGNFAKAQMFSVSVLNTLSEHVISEWKFDESSEASAYDTWNGNTATLNNFNFDSTDGWQTGSKCVSGNCLKFDGNNDYLDCGNSTSFDTDSVTIELWLYLASNPDCDGNNNWRTLLHKNSSVCCATSGYDIVLEENRSFVWDVGAGGESVRWNPSNIILSIGQWTHYVFSYDSSTGKMTAYKNGLAASDSPHTVTAEAIRANSNNLIISNSAAPGSCASGGGGFPGIVDTIRIYDSGFSASRIRQDYYAGLNKLLLKGFVSGQEYTTKLQNLD